MLTYERAHESQRRDEIRAQLLVQRIGLVVERRRRGGTGREDDPVERRRTDVHIGDEPFDLVGDIEIGLQHPHATAQLVAESTRCDFVLVIDADDHVPESREQSRDLAPDAPRGSGHEHCTLIASLVADNLVRLDERRRVAAEQRRALGAAILVRMALAVRPLGHPLQGRRTKG